MEDVLDLERRGQYAEALDALNTLMIREPGTPGRWTFCAYLRCMAMRPGDAEAIRQAERELELANVVPADPFTTGVRGIVAFRKGLYDQAITHISRAIAQNCDSLDFRMFRGISHFQRGEFEPAIADFEQAVRQAPECVPAYRYLASCHGNLGHGALALGNMHQALKLSPQDDSLRIECVEHAISLGKYDSALADLDQLITGHPDWTYSYVVRGIVRWVGGKDLGLVQSDVERALALETRDWSFHALRAVLDYRQAKYARALGDAARCSLVLTHTKFAVRWYLETLPGGHGRFFLGFFWRYRGGADPGQRREDPHDLEHKLVDLGLKALWGASGTPAAVN
jgi:tetratricopeptide (TPR) repeat protein